MRLAAARVAHALAPRLSELARGNRRVLLGVTGAPGVGKSGLAAALVAAFEAEHGDGTAVAVGMDGFHLAQSELVRRGLAQVKGAPETFDAAAFVALVRRLRTTTEAVPAPSFDRQAEQTVPEAVVVRPRHRFVVVEGNYLLLDGPWQPVRDLLDEVWHLQLPDEVRVPGLIARHVTHGRDEEAAREWVHRSDEANARLIDAVAYRADAVVDLTTGCLEPPHPRPRGRAR